MINHEHPQSAMPDGLCAPDPGGEPVPGELNMVFRGLFLFVQRSSMIDVLIPNLGTEHTYRAGSFLGETTLVPRPVSEPYVLRGVTPGNEGFKDIAFPGYDYQCCLGPEDVHARIVIPRPMEILAFRPVQGLMEANDPLGVLARQTLDTVFVFRYKADVTRAHLARHNAPSPNGKGSHRMGGKEDGPLFMNIHVISDPEEDATKEHVVHGFTHVLNLLQGLQGTICIQNAEGTTLQDLTEVDAPVDKGLLSLETMSFSEQRLAMLGIAASWRDKLTQVGDLGAQAVNPPNGCAPVKAGGG